MATTDCGFGKIVSAAFIKQEYTQQYKWQTERWMAVDDSYYHVDLDSLDGFTAIALRQLVICPIYGEYWKLVASFKRKPYNSH